MPSRASIAAAECCGAPCEAATCAASRPTARCRAARRASHAPALGRSPSSAGKAASVRARTGGAPAALAARVIDRSFRLGNRVIASREQPRLACERVLAPAGARFARDRASAPRCFTCTRPLVAYTSPKVGAPTRSRRTSPLSMASSSAMTTRGRAGGRPPAGARAGREQGRRARGVIAIGHAAGLASSGVPRTAAIGTLERRCGALACVPDDERGADARGCDGDRASSRPRAG